MSLRKKAISEDKAKAMGGVPFSHPCKLENEIWIIENMIKDFNRAGWEYAIVESTFKSQSAGGVWTKPALELWKIN
jgi:hypothetical protein